LPLAPVPAGIEMVDLPSSVTQLLPHGSRGVIAEGGTVTTGEPLCSDPVHGSFAAISGRVRRVMPWDGGPRGSFTAVCINSEPAGGRVVICEPVAEPLAADPSLLRSAGAMLGYHLPRENATVFITMLDEDVGSVTNRWFLEKEFDLVVKGVQAVYRTHGSDAVYIAVPDSLTGKRRKLLSQYGRVVQVVPRYPQVLSELTARTCRTAGGEKVPVCIDAKYLAAMAGALQCGCATTNMHVSLCCGRKGQTHLFQIPIGMRIGDFLEGRGISVMDGMQVVLGGEMRGVAADNLMQPLTPVTDTLLVLPPRETVVPENTPCVNCGRCSGVCPAGLRVDLLGKCVEYTRDGELLRLGIEMCIDCGMCAAVCLVRRPLAQLMAYGKQRAARYGNEGEHDG
jgi:ferredoxin